MTLYTFIQSPVITNTPRNIANVSNERRISSDILAETIKGFNRLTLQSTINYSADYHSEKNDAESDKVVDNHTSDRYRHYQQKFSTHIIDQPAPPRYHPICHTNDRHRRDAQRCACFLISSGGKPEGYGKDDSTGRKNCQKHPQIDYPSSY